MESLFLDENKTKNNANLHNQLQFRKKISGQLHPIVYFLKLITLLFRACYINSVHHFTQNKLAATTKQSI